MNYIFYLAETTTIDYELTNYPLSYFTAHYFQWIPTISYIFTATRTIAHNLNSQVSVIRSSFFWSIRSISIIQVYRKEEETNIKKYFNISTLMVVFKNTNFIVCTDTSLISRLSGGGGELGDGLGSLRDGVLSKLTRKEETDGGLDLAGREGRLLVVSGELGGLKSDLVKDVVDEGVEDGDTSLGDTSLRVDLLEDLVDVRRVALDSLLGGFTSLLGGLSSFLSRGLGHF
jgi:hypothetical protein